jgi:hypothetical protein
MQVLSVPKEFNLKWHYSSLRGEKFNKYDVIEKSVYFSLCLDDSTDQTDVNQLLIFVHAIQSDFNARRIAEFSFTSWYHKGIGHF